MSLPRDIMTKRHLSGLRAARTAPRPGLTYLRRFRLPRLEVVLRKGLASPQGCRNRFFYINQYVYITKRVEYAYRARILNIINTLIKLIKNLNI